MKRAFVGRLDAQARARGPAAWAGAVLTTPLEQVTRHTRPFLPLEVAYDE